VKNKQSRLITPLLLIFVFISVALTSYVNREADSTAEVFLNNITLQVLCFALPAIFFCRAKGINYSKDLRLKLFTPSRFLLILYLLPILVIGSVMITLLLGMLGVSVQQEANVSSLPGIASGSELLYAIFTLAFVPALFEEFLFRGIILNEYSIYGGVCAVVMSSLSFAMVHFDLGGFISYLFCGAVLSFLVYVTKSLPAAIVLHFLYNVFNIYAMPYLSTIVAQPSDLLFSFIAAIILLLFFIILALREAEIIYYEYATDPAQSERKAEKKERTPFPLTNALVSPTFIICILIFIAATVLL